MNVMVNLFESGLLQCRPFSRLGVYYSGLISMLKNKLLSAWTYKTYITVFVCISIRAVHLELVSDLPTVASLAAFNWLVSYTARPVHHDLLGFGTNFVSADQHLSQWRRHAINHLAGEVSLRVEIQSTQLPSFWLVWKATVHLTKSLVVRIMGIITTRLLMKKLQQFVPDRCRIEFGPAHFRVDRPSQVTTCKS